MNTAPNKPFQEIFLKNSIRKFHYFIYERWRQQLRTSNTRLCPVAKFFPLVRDGRGKAKFLLKKKVGRSLILSCTPRIMKQFYTNMSPECNLWEIPTTNWSMLSQSGPSDFFHILRKLSLKFNTLLLLSFWIFLINIFSHIYIAFKQSNVM